MPNFLDSIELPDQVLWREQFASQDVAQDVTPLLGGNVHVSAAPVLSGQSMTLLFSEGVAWADQVIVDAIQALAKQAASVFTLQWEGVTYNVVFRHHEAPAVQFEPLWPLHDQYTGEVRLMRV